MEPIAQASLVTTSICNHQGTSLKSFFTSTKQMAKGLMEMAHEITLVSADLRNLRAANDALSKRRKVKKTHLCQGVILIQVEGIQIMAENDTEAQIKCDKERNSVSEIGRSATAWKLSNCDQTGQNTQIYQID